MVNSELFRKIADKIEAEPKLYRQSRKEVIIRGCGTAHCIGGWACALTNNEISLMRAGKLLGLKNWDQYRIFDAFWKPRPDLTVPQALRMIADGASVSEVSA